MSKFNWKNVDFSKTQAFMKLSGMYREQYSYVVLGGIIKHNAKEFGINITDEKLQEFSNQARRVLGLHKKQDFDSFLEKANANYETWENVCENELCRMALRANNVNAVNYIDNAWPIIKSIPEVKEALFDMVIFKGKNFGIELSEQTIQDASDDLRRVLGLHKKADFDNYIFAVGINYDGWEKMVKSELIYKKLVEKDVLPINFDDLVLNKNVSDLINSVISEIIFGHFVESQSEKLGITVNDEEIQAYLNDFRRVHKLHNSKIFTTWLAVNDMTLDDFEVIADMKIRMVKFNAISDNTLNSKEIAKEVSLTIGFLEKAKTIALECEAIEKNEIAKPTEEELQVESDSLRRVFKLHNSQSFNDYLQRNDLNLDNWQDFIEHRIMLKKLRDKIAGDEAIISYLEKNKVLRKTIKDEILANWIAMEV